MTGSQRLAKGEYLECERVAKGKQLVLSSLPMDRKKWRDLSPKTQKALSVGAFLIFLLFSLSLLLTVGIPMVKHARNPELFRSWIDGMGIWGKAAYVGMNILQVLVAVIPGGPLELAGGYAFGHLEAMILSSLGIAIGSALVFLLVRFFGYRLVEAFFPVRKINEVKFLKSSRSRDILLVVLFLVPGTPKDLLSYFCGLTEIRFSVFIAISTFCRIPALWASALGGDAMGDKSYVTAIVIFSIILLCTLLGALIYFLIVKRHRKKNGKEEMQDN